MPGLIQSGWSRSIYSRFPIRTQFIHCRAEVARAQMEPGVQRYAVDLVRRTRAHPFIHYGASPRASVALLLCSKALAAIRGRDFVTPDDVRDVALPVMRHRLTLRAEAELDGVTPDSVITDILKVRRSPEIEAIHRLHRFLCNCGYFETT